MPKEGLGSGCREEDEEMAVLVALLDCSLGFTSRCTCSHEGVFVFTRKGKGVGSTVNDLGTAVVLY